MDRGLRVHAPDRKAAVQLLLQTWEPEERYTLVDRFGWVGQRASSFVTLGGRVLGGERLVPSGSLAFNPMAMPSSSLEDWQARVAARCVGNPLAMLAVSLAFSGPLLGLLDRQSGGFHIRGQSSRGKSTLLGLAASVWGAPGTVSSWRTTDNALEVLAARHNDQVLTLDELHQMDPRKLGQAIYMLGNERGKERKGRNGAAMAVTQWRVPVLSSGEVSVQAHLASAGAAHFGGQEVRLIDLSVDELTSGAFQAFHGEAHTKAFAERLLAESRACHGTAGPAFVQEVLKRTPDADRINTILKAIAANYRQCLDIADDPAQSRVVDRFALTALAGELATLYGITGWTKGLALDALRECAKIWLGGVDGGSRAEVELSLERTRDHLAAQGARFVLIGNATANDGWVDDDWFYFRQETWKLIHGESEGVAAARDHRRAGLLKTGADGKLMVKMPRAVPGRPRAYAVRRSILTGQSKQSLMP